MDYRFSFTDLFTREVDFDKDNQVKVSSIVIPQIQRPYAQGRTDGVCTYIRNMFLDEIFENLTSGNDDIFDLNFIYGIIKPNNNEYRMELLDGQQRLTTLFLLYWYITNAELDINQPESKFIRDCLSKFLYETRTTSTVFCQELSSYKVELGNKTPKEVIRNSKWYFKSFDRDSTISAMLTMLNAIHDRYTQQKQRSLFAKLQKLQFYVKSLGVFNLSEELYIKMNARGLQLSPFENFKADLTNFISQKEYGHFQEMMPLYKDGTADEVSFHFNFSVKLDAKWVDIFWKNGAEDFDNAYMSFFSRFFACKYIIASKNDVSDRDMRTDKTIRILYTNAEEQIGGNEYWGFKPFETLLDEHPEYVETLDKVLDVLYSNERIIYKNMLPIWDKNNELAGDDFYCNTSSKISHIKLIALSAVIEYIEAMESFDISTFECWMRVVWNVIENTNIDGLTPVSSLIRKLSMVIHFVATKMGTEKSFYKALSQWGIENSTEKENRALLEEVEKAKRISEDPLWEDIWKDVEKHPFFKGMVTFFYDPAMSKQDYAHNAKFVKSMFDEKGITKEYRDKHILIRAIVSQFNTWNEVNQLYVTERAENNKFLKNILASNEKVRAMFTHIANNNSILDVKANLQHYIDDAKEPQAWEDADTNGILAFETATKRLRKDIKMYDWISKVERERNGCFRVYWFEGHIMFAIPRKWYAKIALDTERAKMANDLCESYGFEFWDEEQKAMYDKYKDCFGNYIWIKQDRANCTLWIRFDLNHELKIQIECKTKKYAKELYEIFDSTSYIDEEEKCIQFENLTHYTKCKTYNKLCKVIESIYEAIPEA